ncbi:hypothetical protein A5667_24895 [Mycolicibacterium fortuitum]|nr:hypothetical protein A5667_24895 [Mycolicibacterium fortuitum]
MRLEVYDRLEKLKNAGLGVHDLIDTAVDEVRKDENATFHGKSDIFPWTRVSMFLLRLFSIRRVLISGDEVFVPSLMTLTRPVTGFVEDWQYELDGELVVQLLRAGQEITLFNRPDLAGAIYNGRRPEQLSRVLQLLIHLAKSNQIVDDGTGRFFLPGA